MAVVANEPNDPNYIPPTAPFSYSADEYGNVNLNTGAWTHEEVDLVLPGKNGLDLVMKRQWSSEDALDAVYPYVRNSNLVFELRYQYYLGIESWMPFDRNTFQCYESNRIQVADYKHYDWKLVNEGTYYEVGLPYNGKYTFSADEREELLAAKSAFVPFLTWITDKRTGIEYDVYVKPELVHIATNMGNPPSYSRPMVNYVDNLYGFGRGWNYMFSRIEREREYHYYNTGFYTNYYDDTFYLQLADGRRYAWDQYNTDKNYSKLRDYEFEDMQLLKNSGGYPGANWVLTYADGKREYFNDQGYLLAIRDRFDNIITFEYT